MKTEEKKKLEKLNDALSYINGDIASISSEILYIKNTIVECEDTLKRKFDQLDNLNFERDLLIDKIYKLKHPKNHHSNKRIKILMSNNFGKIEYKGNDYDRIISRIRINRKEGYLIKLSKIGYTTNNSVSNSIEESIDVYIKDEYCNNSILFTNFTKSFDFRLGSDKSFELSCKFELNINPDDKILTICFECLKISYPKPSSIDYFELEF